MSVRSGPAQNLLAASSPTTGPSTVDVGPKTDYKTDGITDTWMKAPDKLAVIRQQGKIYACTSVCTHKGCILLTTADKTSFRCPCHHSTFDILGQVTHGPAKLPLVRYAISIDGQGDLIVDKTKTFAPEQWIDPASFVMVY